MHFIQPNKFIIVEVETSTYFYYGVVGGTCLFCHPEFISGSYQFEVLRSTCEMLKRVQHNDFVFNCRRGDCLESLALNVSTVDCYIIFNYSAIKPSHSARSSLSWICSTLGKFRFRHFVPVCSIPSLSGLTSCRPSANPLNPINASHWGSASLKQTFCTSYNNVDRGT